MVSEVLAPVPMACFCAGGMGMFETSQCSRVIKGVFGKVGDIFRRDLVSKFK